MDASAPSGTSLGAPSADAARRARAAAGQPPARELLATLHAPSHRRGGIARRPRAPKEARIGLEVFERSGRTYDPSTDPIVRVQMGRLRKKTLVVGGTGLLGHEICRRLAPTHEVLALVRTTSDADKRAGLLDLGVELVEGDLEDPASLVRALDGVQSVISTASSTFSRQEGDSIDAVDRRGQLSMVAAAAETGVDHFVFLSFRLAPDVRFPLVDTKREVERDLKASGMAWTILQSSFFMEVWFSPDLGFDPVQGKVRVYGGGGRGISWVSYKDVARVAAAVLHQPEARNAVIEVGGPEALSVDRTVS